MSRPLHPLACRVGRAERAQAVAFARANGVSVSGLLKTALRSYLATQPVAPFHPAVVPIQPAVHGAVNGLLSDLLAPPVLVRPYRLARSPQSRAPAVASGVAKGGRLSDW